MDVHSIEPGNDQGMEPGFIEQLFVNETNQS
jgi:hypothetical protein